MKKKIIFGSVLVLVVLGIAGLLEVLHVNTIRAQYSIASTVSHTVSYRGVAHTDALTLLEQNHSVKQDASGFVTAIDNASASSATHTYWAFYVNGRLASVGPQAYITHSNDVITWKIEKY